ncbi:MAG: hypothetical protein FWC64_00430 [Treponema sp.]|nr:hypothetical protein [Treponema sp.]
MKKILLVFVALALAGGGAFAQGWTFNGLASGGFGAFFFERQDDGPEAGPGDRLSRYGLVAPINWDAANTPFRTQLDARFANADNTAGLTFRVRAQGAATGATDLPAWFDWGFGWMSFMDNMVTVQGGRVEYGFFAPLDRMFHQEVGGGIGVQTIVRPMDGLVLGLGAFSAGFGGADLPTNNGIWNDADRMMLMDGNNQMLGTIQVSYTMPDLLRVTAGARTESNVGTSGFGDSRMATGITGLTLSPTRFAAPSAAYISAAFLGMPDLHAAFTARFMNIHQFGDMGDIRLYLTAGHTGLVENLDLRLGFSLGLTMEDNIYVRNFGTVAAAGIAPGERELINNDPSPHVWVWLSAAYALSDVVVPRLDVHYVMGGQWNGWQRMHHWSPRDGATFDSDDMFIQIRPAVQFRITAATFVELGGIFNIDLSDAVLTEVVYTYREPNDGSWGRSGVHGLNIGAYALVRVSF